MKKLLSLLFLTMFFSQNLIAQIKTWTGNISTNVGTQQAAQTITATNKVLSTGNVVYQAGNAVQFNPGFEANTGAVFKVQIGGCN